MTAVRTPPPGQAAEGDYAWAIAKRFPQQGFWSENDYFALLDQSGTKGFELVQGQIEVLPVPTRVHQLLCGNLFVALFQFVQAGKLGEVHFSGLGVKIDNGLIREPDIVFIGTEKMDRAKNKAFEAADLCMEVVSGSADDRRRDYVDKLKDYASRGVSEYWIVDPEKRCVMINRLDGDHYVEHGTYREGNSATSVLLEGFAVDVAELFAAIDRVEA